MHNIFRVVHISDIHFRRGFPLSQWIHVKKILSIHRPSAIIATGDFVEHPWPLMLVLARREMLELGRKLEVPVLTIPGNHDVAFMGWIPIWPLNRLYGGIFSKKNDGWLMKGFPTFEEFYTTSVVTRFFWRWLLNLKIAWRWITFGLRNPVSREDLIVYKDQMPLRVVGFDSNRSLFLASGSVTQGQIDQFGTYANTLELRPSLAEALLPRIALIHHHLVPIPYTRKGAAENEPLLVLRNAGTLLRELWEHDFDLVLHGHRHYSNFARIAYERTEVSGRELAVLSGASPTTSEPEANSNSFHFVDFHTNGRIRLREFRFGSGKTIQNSGQSEMSFDALSVNAIKVRNYRRMLKVMGHACDELSREISVNSVGATTERIIYKSLTVQAGTQLQQRHLRMTVDRGSITSTAFREIKEEGLWSSGCYLSYPPHTEENPKRAEALVTFNPPLVDGKSATFGVEYQTANSFAMSRWEFTTFPSNDRDSDLPSGPVGVREEACVMRVRFPIRRIRLLLNLPNCLLNPRPYAVCYSPHDYPVLEADENGDIKAPNGKPAWSPDGDMSEYENRFVRQLSENAWEFQVEYPLVGYRYELRWGVEDVREQTVDRKKAGETVAYRNIMVTYARNGYGKSRKRMPVGSARVREILSRKFLEPIYQLVPNTVGSREDFRVCVFVFDGDSRDLIAVEEVTKGGALPVTDTDEQPFKIPFGEGVAGLAFKRCAGISYSAPVVTGQHDVAGTLFKAAEAGNLKAVLGVPLYHPDAWVYAEKKLEGGQSLTWSDLPSVYQVIGVITFSSNSEASGLAAFQEGADAAEFFEAIDALVRDASRELLSAIRDATLEIA